MSEKYPDVRINQLIASIRKFDSESFSEVETLLHSLYKTIPKNEAAVLALHDALLFLMAYPGTISINELAREVMEELVQEVERQVSMKPAAFYNSGISGSLVCAQFGLYLNHYLLNKGLSQIELSEIDGEQSNLVTDLTFALNPVEQELMPEEAGYYRNWKKQFSPEQKSASDLLRFIVSATLSLPGTIASRESRFGEFGVYTLFRLERKLYGLSLGRLPRGEIQIHPQGITKKITLEEVIAKGKPVPIRLKHKEQQELVDLARGVMASLLRETDTYTYANTAETELHDMGEGIQIAIYYLVEEQKFSLQSYVGFLLFKNSVPLSYGGCWLFAAQAAFGMNILPPFRGGESAKIMGELLRLYHFRFRISQFTIDPFQIGKDNEDGIQSGAFWFYYKLGFRPLGAKHLELAESEAKKLNQDKNYRSPRKILKTLANSELYWQFQGNQEPYYPLNPLGVQLSQYLSSSFGGNRQMALNDARKKFHKMTGKKMGPESFFNRVLDFWVAHKALEKLKPSTLIRLMKAYHHKGSNEAKAHLDLQRISPFSKVFDT